MGHKLELVAFASFEAEVVAEFPTAVEQPVVVVQVGFPIQEKAAAAAAVVEAYRAVAVVLSTVAAAAAVVAVFPSHLVFAWEFAAAAPEARHLHSPQHLQYHHHLQQPSATRDSSCLLQRCD